MRSPSCRARFGAARGGDRRQQAPDQEIGKCGGDAHAVIGIRHQGSRGGARLHRQDLGGHGHAKIVPDTYLGEAEDIDDGTDIMCPHQTVDTLSGLELGYQSAPPTASGTGKLAALP